MGKNVHWSLLLALVPHLSPVEWSTGALLLPVVPHVTLIVVKPVRALVTVPVTAKLACLWSNSASYYVSINLKHEDE